MNDEERFGQDYSDYNEREYIVAKKVTDVDAGEIEMRNGKELTEMFEPDWELACIFHNFLSGISDRLPKFEFMDQVYMERNEIDPTSDIISAGYGLIVEKNATLDIAEKITDSIERHDIIAPEEHFAYEVRSNRERKEIDIEKYPRIDEKRVKHVQKFLNEYVNHMTKGEVKSK
ncbi:MAG: hypothetical protein IJI43_00430 [Bacilli bacterium]|nr:hypothetical protein [Bacilli bacterium]